MPVTYTIDRAKRLIYVVARGEISVEDLMENEGRIIKDPELGNGFNTFADFSKAKPSHTDNLDKVRLSKKFVESIQHHRGICKWAIFAPDDESYSYSLMFATISKDLHITTEVFRDKNEAIAWLNSRTDT